MQLGGETAPDIAAEAGAVLDRHLRAESARPVAVAFSGGGDSLALLLAADAWRRRTGRRLLVLTIDHRLQAESRAWTEGCAERAGRLGLPFRSLVWEGPRPATGLAAAARQARHRLLAAAAREAGAQVLLMGHTADDVLEARAMRADGATTPEPRIWGPSPSWPDGRDLFLLRPLLGARRASLRRWLAEHGETWIDDPANEDPGSARSRARRQVAVAPSPQLSEPAPLALAASVGEPVSGVLRVPREAVRAAAGDDLRRLLSLMAVCAGGGARPPSGEALARIAAAFRSDVPATVTLAGARLEAGEDEVRALRESGEARRGGLAPLSLEPGEPVVWDGRFELEALRPGLSVQALSGRMARLSEPERRHLNAWPASARPGLPAIVETDGSVSCPLAAPRRDLTLRSLLLPRLQAAAGLVEREPA